MAFNLRMSDEQREKLEVIRKHYGCLNLTSAIWIAVTKAWREIVGDKGEK